MQNENTIYSPSSIPDFNYDQDLGHPGQAPFTRGIYPDMYQKKKFTMRQLTGFASPKETNNRMKYMLKNGATGLSILFDFPTIQMYDSDDLLSKGHVGMSGVCIDSIEDMKILFQDIDIENISISLVTHYPSNTAILFSMFLAMAEEQKIPWNKLRGSIQNDIIMEEVVRCGNEFISPKNCFRIQCDNIEFVLNHLPKWNPITLNGYNLRESGTSAITEMAIAIVNGITTIEEMIKRGYKADQITKNFAFFWSISNDFFEEISRLRAVRRLWYNIIKNIFKIDDDQSLRMKCHVQTSGISLVRQEPLNNIIRATIQALSATLGGVQSLHVDSYDEAYSVPTEESSLISLRTQEIIQEETFITDIIDPLGGSYYIENLTNSIEKQILNEINEINKSGGFISLIETGKLHEAIASYSYQRQKDIDSGKIKIVAYNKYQSDSKTSKIKTLEYSELTENEQCQKLKILRTQRDNIHVNQSLKKLGKACKQNENIFQYCLACASARCTEGEMFKVFKKSFGLWNPPISY